MRRSLVFLLLILGVLSAAVAGEKLRYKFVKDKTYKYQIHTESKANGSMNGTEFSAETKSDLVFVIVPSGPTAGGTELVASLEAAKSVINIPVMGLRDSTIEMKELLGKRVKVVVSDLGKTVSVTPIDSLPASQILMMSGVSPTEIFRRLFLQLPEKEVEKNGSWKEMTPDTTRNNNVTIVSKPDVVYQVQGAETHDGLACWKISITGKTTTDGGGTVRGLDVTVDGTSKSAGTVLFAPADGVMVSYESSADVDQTQTFSGAQTGSQSMTMKVTNSSKLIK